MVIRTPHRSLQGNCYSYLTIRPLQPIKELNLANKFWRLVRTPVPKLSSSERLNRTIIHWFRANSSAFKLLPNIVQLEGFEPSSNTFKECAPIPIQSATECSYGYSKPALLNENQSNYPLFYKSKLYLMSDSD